MPFELIKFKLLDKNINRGFLLLFLHPLHHCIVSSSPSRRKRSPCKLQLLDWRRCWDYISFRWLNTHKICILTHLGKPRRKLQCQQCWKKSRPGPNRECPQAQARNQDCRLGDRCKIWLRKREKVVHILTWLWSLLWGPLGQPQVTWQTSATALMEHNTLAGLSRALQ